MAGHPQRFAAAKSLSSHPLREEEDEEIGRRVLRDIEGDTVCPPAM